MTELVAVDWDALAGKSLAGERLSREQARSILQAPDEQLLGLLDAAFLVRRSHFGVAVKLNMIVNAKSGICPED